MRSKNEKVQQFLDELKVKDAAKLTSLLEMRKMLFEIFPNTEERMMYGGIMFSNNMVDFCGLFVRKKHISFEFSNGPVMNDPLKNLEGTVKTRRHLKIRTLADIKDKDVLYYVKQAL